MNEQDEVCAFLGRGAERIETHISVVFLAGALAYKLKRAVRFSYLDYSTLALREKYCRAELALNRRTAPGIYRAVRAVTREADGTLALDGAGPAVEWVVEMRRFEQDALFDRMALTPALMRELTDEIAVFHAQAERVSGYGGAAALAEVMAGNGANLLAAGLPQEAVARLDAAGRARLAAVGAVLDARRDAGKVRRCHGDLHLGNICLWDGKPVLFDCIEFNDAFSCIDVLYDLAFLLMDLRHRGERDFASLVLNRYLDRTGEADGLAVLGLFMSVRAAIRAHVLAVQGRAEAGGYLALAEELLAPRAPCLVAVGGLSGSGKSTLAAALAGALGARVIRSDVVRKALAGVAPEVRLPEAAYDAATTARVYAALHEQAREALAAGFPVILDATFLRAEERRAVAELAPGVPFLGVWLEAPVAVLAARLAARRGDASDADVEILHRQLRAGAGAVDWWRVDAAQGVTAQVGALIARMSTPT
jgi:aminoglycoside phosphotransferase family enzyme/predicted kinase